MAQTLTPDATYDTLDQVSGDATLHECLDDWAGGGSADDDTTFGGTPNAAGDTFEVGLTDPSFPVDSGTTTVYIRAKETAGGGPADFEIDAVELRDGVTVIDDFAAQLPVSGTAWTNHSFTTSAQIPDSADLRLYVSIAYTGSQDPQRWRVTAVRVEVPDQVTGPDQPTLTVETEDTHDTGSGFTGSAFSGGSGTHSASQWQVDTEAGDFSTPVIDSGEDSTNLTSYLTAHSLSADTAYKARVRYKDDNGDWSDWSTAQSFRTAYAAPSSAAVDETRSTEVDLSWTDNASGSAKFRVSWQPTSADPETGFWSSQETAAAGTTSDTVADLATGTEYRFKVDAVSNTDGDDVYSEPTSTVTTTTDQSASTTLTGVSAAGKTGTMSVTGEAEFTLTGTSAAGLVGSFSVSGSFEIAWNTGQQESAKSWSNTTSDRQYAWKRLENFEYVSGTFDFAPVISSFPQWLVSSNTRNTINLRSEASIAGDFDIEGLP